VKLSDLGEFGLIDRIASRYTTSHASTLKGIGDDAAVLSFDPNDVVLVSTDQLIEDVDFRLKTTSAANLGWKSLAINLSDIAAMGGIPAGFLVSLGIPSARIPLAFLDEFYDGLMRLAAEASCDLLGGDVSESGERFIVTITIVGTAKRGAVVYRGGGRDNDDLYVTGQLGEAALGLKILEAGGVTEGCEPLIQRQECPLPRLKEGLLLAQRGIAHAMIDVSDGLLADLNHMVTESGIGAEIDCTAVPLSAALQAGAALCKEDALELALTGGEDFELLFSAAPEQRDAINQVEQECMCPITRIGRLSQHSSGIVILDRSGAKRTLGAAGFDHFKKTMREHGE